MFNTTGKLLGAWIVEMLSGHFSARKEAGGDKLFTRVAGMDDQAWGDVLEAFREAEFRLTTHYRLILRTLSRVEGYQEYECQEHETSTWLRNNNPQGSALVIFMNDRASEAQSLENIFMIDEARLLSAEGLEVLYRLLADRHRLFGTEMESLKVFMTMYGDLAEPQLRNVLAFLIAVLGNPSLSILDSIQRNLDKLLLFRDSTLPFKATEGKAKLKRNYQLSRLEREGRAVSKEDFVDNLYAFVERATDESEANELWERVEPDQFRQQALDFIHNRSNELLQYEFDMIASALHFKPGKKKWNEKINDFKTLIETKQTLEEKQEHLIRETLEAIEVANDPDKIQEFIDEFIVELQEHPKLRKDLERTMLRQRQLAEYTELTDALIRESVLLLEGLEEERPEGASLVLRIVEASLSEQQITALRFHLNGIERLLVHITCEVDEWPESSNKPKGEVTCQLVLRVEGHELASSKFKLVNAFGGMLGRMLERLASERRIPYLQLFDGEDIRSADILQDVKTNAAAYALQGRQEVAEAAVSFCQLVDQLRSELEEALVSGLSTIDFVRLESELEQLLRDAGQSPLIVNHIYRHIGLLGVCDSYDCKAGDRVGTARERVVTLLNPIRLLGYSKRLASVRDVLGKWLGQGGAVFEESSDLDTYFRQQQEKTTLLAPHYFSNFGEADQFLIERQERMGEGVFTPNGRSSGEEHLVGTFGDEFMPTVKTYLEVYPYARDCLDVIFLYCTHSDYVKRAIETIFRSTKVRKVKAIIHSETRGAAIYEELNVWLTQEERYSEKYYAFPKVEISVIAESSVNKLMSTLDHTLLDADIGVLVNYFGQSSSVQYKLEKVAVQDSDNWFDSIYREPLYRNDNIKRVNLISESLPKLMQHFYRMQFMLNNGGMLTSDEHYLLRNVIALNRQADMQLLDYMHQKFNWSLIIDRHLDKSLLKYVSPQAQIIKYKSNAGKDKGLRTLVSSSKYIRRLVNEQNDHEYFDRLYQKFVGLLKNDQLNRSIVHRVIERVKEISGGIVLRAIGPGKFAHELLAIYLSTEARAPEDGELVVWAVCDELPWFNEAGRRPDLVRTSIRRAGDKLELRFELVELKFISHTIFEQERYDAIKQVQAGLDVYRNRFDFSRSTASAELWRKELLYYLLEYNAYDLDEGQLLKELQRIPIDRIELSFSGSIDTFVYTSNLLERSIMEGHKGGYQKELLHQEFVNHIYNRSYVLKALGAMQEAEVPSFDEPQGMIDYVSAKLGLEPETLPDSVVLSSSESLDEENSQETKQYGDKDAFSINNWNVPEIAAENKEKYENESGSIDSLPFVAASLENSVVPVLQYPEEIALYGLEKSEEPAADDVAALVEEYKKKLRYSFNQVGIDIRVVDSFVGVSVIRLVMEIPLNKTFRSIESRAEDIYLWLKLSAIPLIALRNGRITIDINRDAPETVYFERFVQQVREQYPPARLKGKLVTPIGVGQLRELIAMDFSSSNTPHLLIGGTTGSGKSVTMNAIILGLMCLYGPEEVQFIFVDPKKVEFMPYENRTHTREVITEIEEAIVALEQLVEEMEQRYRIFAQEGVSSIDEYAELACGVMPRLVVVFDEFADFMEREKSLSSLVESAILRLGAKARAAGIHLLICTQNPKADIVPTNIRNNLPARLALKAADHHASKIIINEEGAETLGGKGDFLMKLDAPETIRGKSPFLTPAVKRALLQYFRKAGGQI
ncbi:FtsK/SpoIIIE domain-containing protein [Paenibacillus paeoniae]|uniref:DNA translocase FtsK n=1 Tax=Paenibacillus paeoniae TaxID=2292705 RepID=A0A371PF06_9BACL|nr:FtsK/SpoIIIE domain-containing protein [Paenibacillus paeoniae]REK74206.1 DNA translocase FtsK [Paenibacillus paeoniae]